jgi:large-conductance mechanosensitive channel
VVYFFVVRPFTAMAARFAADTTPAGPTNEEKLLTEIRDTLRAQRP